MDDVFELMLEQQRKTEVQRIVACNEKTKQFGLELTQENVNALLVCRKDSLIEQQRVEFNGGVLPDIIHAFCDSQYMNQENYMETLEQLQEIFYLYKNESLDEVPDSELIYFMREQYEQICFGDIDYLRSTCLERFARAIRFGWQSQMQKRLRDEYTCNDVDDEYSQLSEETRWEYEVYKAALEDKD